MLADHVLARLIPDYSAEADPERAAAQSAYMRDQFPFLGLSMGQARKLYRGIVKGLPAPTPADLSAVALACWELPEREFQYFACDYLRANPGDPTLLPTLRTLLTTNTWWDTVDPLATRVVGDLVRAHTSLSATMDEWSADDNKWLVRTAILHQLHWGPATDTARLFRYCTAQAGHPDFFVRKAIGWALRHYARTDPSAVRSYVAERRDSLSPLSIREATKHL